MSRRIKKERVTIFKGLDALANLIRLGMPDEFRNRATIYFDGVRFPEMFSAEIVIDETTAERKKRARVRGTGCIRR